MRRLRIGSIALIAAIALWIVCHPRAADASPDNSVCLSKVTRIVSENYCTNWQTVVTGQDTLRSCDANYICHNTYIDIRSRICSGYATRQVPREMCVWGCKAGFTAVPGQGADDGCYTGEALAKRIQKAARNGAASPTFRQVQNYLQRCDLGQGESCRVLGVMYGEGTSGLERDDGEAAHLFDRACDNDDMLGCALFGSYLATGGPGLAVDEAMAVAPLRKACEGLEASACAMLGIMYAAGRGGVTPDRNEARRLFRQTLALEPQNQIAQDWIKQLEPPR